MERPFYSLSQLVSAMAPLPRHQSPSQTAATWPRATAFCASSKSITTAFSVPPLGIRFGSSDLHWWTAQTHLRTMQPTSAIRCRNCMRALKPSGWSIPAGGEFAHIHRQSFAIIVDRYSSGWSLATERGFSHNKPHTLGCTYGPSTRKMMFSFGSLCDTNIFCFKPGILAFCPIVYVQSP